MAPSVSLEISTCFRADTRFSASLSWKDGSFKSFVGRKFLPFFFFWEFSYRGGGETTDLVVFRPHASFFFFRASTWFLYLTSPHTFNLFQIDPIISFYNYFHPWYAFSLWNQEKDKTLKYKSVPWWRIQNGLLYTQITLHNILSLETLSNKQSTLE